MAIAEPGLMDHGQAPAPLLSAEQVEAFRRDGFLLLPGFYDLAREIAPIQRASTTAMQN